MTTRRYTTSERARARFFVRVEQRGRATARDERTLPLFPLWLILDADGTLARECRSIVERTQA
jgi:hypothetical protein